MISTGTEQAIRRGHPLRVAALFAVASLVVIGIVWQLVHRLGLPDWVLYGAVGAAADRPPDHAGHRPARAAARGGADHRPVRARRSRPGSRAGSPGGRRCWAAGSRSADWRSLAAAYTAMRLLGIGPGGHAGGLGRAQGPGAARAGRLREPDRRLDAGPVAHRGLPGGPVPVAHRAAARRVRRSPTRCSGWSARAAPRFPPPLARELAEREGIKARRHRPDRSGGEGLRALGQPGLRRRRHGAHRGPRDRRRATASCSAPSTGSRRSCASGSASRWCRSAPIAPLEQVTTGSLAALQKYSEALRLEEDDQPEAAIPLLQEAVALDTGFAMAYRKLAVVYGNLGGNDAGQVAAATRAYSPPRPPARARGRSDGRVLPPVRRLRPRQGGRGVSRGARRSIRTTSSRSTIWR